MPTPAPSVCFYFQVHQPHRLRDIRSSEIGTGNVDFFDDRLNAAILKKVAKNCYLPANRLWLKALRKNRNLRIAFSLSGTFIDQCRNHCPDVLRSFRTLADTGQVEFLGETYYHSLSSLFSPVEFAAQVKKHSEEIRRCFGQKPKTFRNTELIASNEIAAMVKKLGFTAMLTEGVDRILRGRDPTHVFVSAQRSRPIRLLLKHYRLSDDIAFRFGDKGWKEYPLTADTFAEWILRTPGTCVNLFMDYETFGEHQWADTGIFDFLDALPAALQKRGIGTKTPSDVAAARSKTGQKPDIYDLPQSISWADSERDISAWTGNLIQDGANDAIYALAKAVKATKDPSLIETWRKLLTSDHVYYMCTKYWSDGDVHKYFSPYASPYEAYRRFSNAVIALRAAIQQKYPPHPPHAPHARHR